jgi:hypothetical protein
MMFLLKNNPKNKLMSILKTVEKNNFLLMTEQNSNHNQLVAINLDALSFDSFQRNPHHDIVCGAPVRTVVRREEEIILIRKVRKVEEIDASPACPVNTTQINQN